MTVTIESINAQASYAIQEARNNPDLSLEQKQKFEDTIREKKTKTAQQYIELIDTLRNKSEVIASGESENVDFDQAIDQIESSKGHEKERALEFLKEIEEHSSPEVQKLITNTIEVNELASARFLIEKAPSLSLTSSRNIEISDLKDAIDGQERTSSSNIEIPDLRNAIDRQERIVEIKTFILLQHPQNNFESNVKLTTDKNFEANVRWIAERGFQQELHLIDEIFANVSFFQNLTNLRHALVKIAKTKISKRLNNGLKFRVFCSRQELLSLSVVQDNYFEVYIIDEYAGFIMVSIFNAFSDDLVTEIRKKYLVEAWAEENISFLNIDQSNNASLGPGQMNLKNQIIQFNAPMRQNWREVLKNAGVKILQPLSYTQLIVSVPNEQALEEIRKFEYVANIRPFQPSIRVKLEDLESLNQEFTEEMHHGLAIKLHEITDGSQEQDNFTDPGILVAHFLTEDYRKIAEHHFIEAGISILNSPGETKLILDLSSGENIREHFRIITEQPGLESVEEKPIPTLFNYHAAFSVKKGTLPSSQIDGIYIDDFHLLKGEGEIIAIADSGLDSGTRFTQHPDFRNQILDIRSYPLPPSSNSKVCNPGGDDGCADFFTGHGTHVAGSVLGNGKKAADFGLSIKPQGIAPNAKLFFQAIEQTAHWNDKANTDFFKRYGRFRSTVNFWGIPDSLKELFQDAFNNGARIHSNSWGAGNKGSYSQYCKELDQFVWDNKDFLIVTAAGNDGTHGYSSVTPLGTAKNCLTVGASCNHSVATFSSRGPCNDGRLKPDLLAPGTAILSTRSTQLAQSNYVHKNYLPTGGDSYMYMDGTSMATPLIAGCAALLRQFLRSPERNADRILNPSAALLKSALIHSAEYLFYKDHVGPWFDSDQGWGRIKLASILAPVKPNKVYFKDVSQDDGVNSEIFHTYKIKVVDSSVNLRATLAYTDQPIILRDDPWNTYLSEVLISNLNLELISPDNKHYCGNDQNGSGQLDSRNNVEGVIITTPEVGDWEIRIIAATPFSKNDDSFKQDYALVVSGAVSHLERI